MARPASANGFQMLDTVDVSGKRVLVRADLNVPLESGIVRDATRIRRIVPTLHELAEKGAIVIVLSHLGRPKGSVVPSMSLAPVAGPLSVALDHPVKFVATDWIDGEAQRAVEKAMPGDILLLENTRFHPGEEQNQPSFVKTLMDLGDIYVNDAFSAAHRAHASTEGLAWFLPSVAGRAMEKEMAALHAALDAPERPVTGVIGGAKISTKLDMIGHLCCNVDTLIIGGGMANTFLAAQGHPVGRSLAEHDMAKHALEILENAECEGCRIFLPTDVVVAEDFKPHAHARTVSIDDVSEKEMILDIGPGSIKEIGEIFAQSRTLVWNGPLGAFELQPFDAGTVTAARQAAELSKAGKLRSIAGGGDTVAALSHAGVVEDFTYVSTAGGAFLEWLEGKTLPGVKVLEMCGAGALKS
ncbi:MAG: phosphoglycerate kinase [Hyphomicrobiales bacterium]